MHSYKLLSRLVWFLSVLFFSLFSGPASKHIQVHLEVQAEVLCVSVAGNLNMMEPVSPIELRADVFVGGEQKPEAGTVNGGWFR